MRPKKRGDLKIADLRLYMNTDTVDIGLKQIGVHTNQMRPNRGLCIGIRHNGGSQNFRDANTIAQLITASPELFLASEIALDLMESVQWNDDDIQPEWDACLNLLRAALARAGGA